MKKTLLATVLCGVTLPLCAQQKVYRDKRNNEVAPELATVYEITEKSADSTHQLVKVFTLDDVLTRSTSITRGANPVMDGPLTLYNPGGLVLWQINYKDGKRNGESKAYHANGKLARTELYENDTFVSGHCYDENGQEIPFFEMEKRPEYPGGMQACYDFIGEHFKVRGKDTGQIIVSFVVEKDGSIVEAKIVRGLNDKMDKEALRVVNSMPKWIPGQQNGKNVRVQFALPIKIAAQN